MEGCLKSVLKQWSKREKGRHPLAKMKYIFRKAAVSKQ